MTLLQGMNAAIIADGAYSVAEAIGGSRAEMRADALDLAGDDPRFSTDAREDGPSISVPVTPVDTAVSASGALRKKQAGFGVLLERHGAIKGEYIMAMRGTMPPMFTSADWLSNYQIGMARGPSGCPVHAGFNDIYNKMRVDVQTMIAEARPKPVKMHFVGHSLGGALATLAALDYAKAATGATYLYTFGAPRVGSVGIAGDIRRYIGVGNVKRVYALADPVPMIPLLPFQHCDIGATGVNAGFGGITGDAHSMKLSYIQNMTARGWPPEVIRATKSNPKYWLEQAEKSSGFGSKMGYWALSAALAALMPVLHLLCGGVSATLTLADLLMEGVRRSARLALEVGDMILRFVKAALRFAVGFVDRGLEVADLTASFLNYVLDMVMARLVQAARAAIKHIV
ncbi:MAG: lipase family protein [Pseudomonadota bacterium]